MKIDEMCEDVMKAVEFVVELIRRHSPINTHSLHDLIGGNECLSLTCLKGLLYEAEVRKLVKFDIDKHWCV